MKTFQLASFIFCVLIVMTVTQSSGQQRGQLRIIQDPRIDSLMHLHNKLNKTLAEHGEGFLDGFRIQIFMDSGNDAVERAEAVIENFNQTFPNIPAYLVYRQPYYRVRVGDFRTRLEAEGHLERISKQHGQAFVIKDKIRMPQLIYFENQQQDL